MFEVLIFLLRRNRRENASEKIILNVHCAVIVVQRIRMRSAELSRQHRAEADIRE